MSIKWLDEPEEHDYPAAEAFLSLVIWPHEARELVKELREAPVTEHRANDVLRASRLPLLPPTDISVIHDVEKIKDDKDLSPVLLVVERKRVELVIADGYHRVCAIVAHDTKAMIRAKVVYR